MVGRFNWKIAGMLAVVIGVSAILSGCGSSEQAEDRPGMYPTTPDPSTLEQPSAPTSTAASASNDAIEAYGGKYLIDFNEEDYVEKYSINTDIQILANNDASDGQIFWLDVDLLREEIAYADALAEAYDNGTCPEEIKDEAEILYFIKNYLKDDTNGQWAFFIASINSYYNIVALKSAEMFSVK
jgi:hypothetical protein